MLLRWHGGKGAFNGKLAKWILSHLPSDYVTYAEPYFGGGNVLLYKEPKGAEVVNDLSLGLSYMWRALTDTRARENVRLNLQFGAVSQESFDNALETIAQDLEILKQLEESRSSNPDYLTALSIDSEITYYLARVATKFFIIARQSRQGLCRDYATPSHSRTRSGIEETVSAWFNSVGLIDTVVSRLQSVKVYNLDALRFISMHDAPGTVFYLDPPYLKSTRTARDAYEHEMTYDQHKELLTKLASIKGKFLLSGYRSELYDRWATFYKWRRVDFAIANNSSADDVKETKVECLWLNY
jgi:DNA adenine methylase